MKSFNQYFEDKQLAEDQLQNAIVDEENKKKIKEETSPAGWGEFADNPEVTDTFIKWVTGKR